MKKFCRNGAIVVATIIGVIAPEARRSANGSPLLDSQQGRVITFAERVAYQYAIEDVYWRHRIWPKENPNPKPSLDQVMSRAQIEKKVEDYLRDSQLLADQRQRPITPAELQAEMDRMASHTKQSDVLRELFAALNNDPLVIAECLARPLLAKSFRAESRNPVERPISISTGSFDFAQDDAEADAAYNLPEISVSLDCTNDTWTPTTLTNAPAGRYMHTAVWTGSEMIAWGGLTSSEFANTGGRYTPSTDSWTATSTTNAPGGRGRHTAVWTGTQMIVWGGYNSGATFLNTGGRYSLGTDSWTATSTTNAPTARRYQTAVWTGVEMIIWGGTVGTSVLNTGGKYCAQPSTPTIQSAISQKTHGAAGMFNVDLPLTGPTGVECRTGAATSDYTMVVSFSGNVTVTGSPQVQVTLGTGCVGTGSGCSGNVNVSGNTVTVPLTNIANTQTINVRINGVNNAGIDAPATDFTIPISILVGDTNANGTVNAADVAQTKSRLGQTVDSTNFRSDVNANGSINAADTAIVKQNSGTSLPP